jgi:hypothetical protein
MDLIGLIYRIFKILTLGNKFFGSLTVLAAKIPPSVKKTFFEEKSAKTCATTQSCGTHEALTAKIVKEPIFFTKRL